MGRVWRQKVMAEITRRAKPPAGLAKRVDNRGRKCDHTHTEEEREREKPIRRWRKTLIMCCYLSPKSRDKCGYSCYHWTSAIKTGTEPVFCLIKTVKKVRFIRSAMWSAGKKPVFTSGTQIRRWRKTFQNSAHENKTRFILNVAFRSRQKRKSVLSQLCLHARRHLAYIWTVIFHYWS